MTLDDAFQLMKDKLDAVIDIFEATDKFRKLLWPVGEPVHVFLTRYLEEGTKAGLTSRQSCEFMITQLPAETQQC